MGCSQAGAGNSELGNGSSLWLPVWALLNAWYIMLLLPGTELFVLRGEGWGRTHKLITRPTAKFILPARRNAGKNRAPTPPPPAHPSCGMWKMHLKRRTGPGPKDLGICTSIYRLAPSKWSSTRNCSSKNNDCLMSCPLSIIIEWKLAKYAKCCLLLRASSSGRRRGGRRRGRIRTPASQLLEKCRPCHAQAIISCRRVQAVSTSSSQCRVKVPASSCKTSSFSHSLAALVLSLSLFPFPLWSNQYR